MYSEKYHCSKVRDWSLIIGRGGGLQNGRGLAHEVLPLRKRGGWKGFSHAKGGHKKFWGIVFTW